MPKNQDAFTPAIVEHRTLVLDKFLIILSFSVLIISLFFDILNGRADWFTRSGGVVIVFAAILAYRSITKHQLKNLRNFQREIPLSTSKAQNSIDRFSLLLTILGTIIWAYGDKILICFKLVSP